MGGVSLIKRSFQPNTGVEIKKPYMQIMKIEVGWNEQLRIMRTFSATGSHPNKNQSNIKVLPIY